MSDLYDIYDRAGKLLSAGVTQTEAHRAVDYYGDAVDVRIAGVWG